jgi:Ca-activated chloride channel family protein
MTQRNPKSFRGPKAWAVLATLILGTVAVAWASHESPAGIGHGMPVLPAHPIVTASGPVGVATRIDRTAVMQGSDGLVRMELLLRGEERATVGESMPSDLIVMLDRSGSMNGEKIEQARRALKDLIERLGPEDRFSLVSFNGSASNDIPLSPATEENRAAWTSRVGGIGAGGGTCISCAMEQGVGIVESTRSSARASRLLLISDGLSSPNGLTDLAMRAARGESVVSTIGVGLDFNEQLMTSVADAGTGNFYFLENAATLAQVFEGEFLAARATVASSLEVTLRPPPGVEVVDAAGYPLERTKGGPVIFRPGALFSGQERRVWISYRFPTAEPGVSGLGPVSVGFRDGDEIGRVVVNDLPRIACVRDESIFRERLDGVVAMDALKNEEYGKLQQLTSSLVAAGRRDEAKKAVDEYRQQVLELAEAEPALAPAAMEVMNDADVLGKEAEEAFTGDNQHLKQRAFAQENNSVGWSNRRAGAKYDKKGAK